MVFGVIPVPAILQIFSGTGLKATLTNSTSVTPLRMGTKIPVVLPVLKPLPVGKTAALAAAEPVGSGKRTGPVSPAWVGVDEPGPANERIPVDDLTLETLTVPVTPVLPPSELIMVAVLGPVSRTNASVSTTNVPSTN